MKRTIDLDQLNYPFPFLARIPQKKLPTAINALSLWQKKHHGVRLEVDRAIDILKRGGKLPAGPRMVINAPLSSEEQEIDTLKEMASNTDIKERVG